MGRCHNDRCKKCYRKDCRDNKCVREVVIKSLPHLIDEPGTYCLCKDFEWAGPGPAIKISSNDVVLKFNTKTITLSDDPNIQAVLVEGVTGVDIIGARVSGGKDPSVALLIENSAAVNIIAPVLTEIERGIRVNRSHNVTLKELKFLNSLDVETTNQVVNFYICNNVKVHDAQIVNGRLAFVQCVNVEVLRANIDNQNNQRCIQFDSVSDEPGPPSPEQVSRNVRVADSQLSTDDFALLNLGIPQGAFGFLNDCPVGQALFENNVVTGVVFVQFATDTTIRNNRIKPTPAFLSLGIAIEAATTTVIENNHISDTLGDLGNISVGISVFDWFNDESDAISNNTLVIGNTVIGKDVGFTDNLLGLFSASNSIFKDNIASGNVLNYDLTSSTTMAVDNLSFNQISIPNSLARTTVTNNKALEIFPIRH